MSDFIVSPRTRKSGGKAKSSSKRRGKGRRGPKGPRYVLAIDFGTSTFGWSSSFHEDGHQKASDVTATDDERAGDNMRDDFGTLGDIDLAPTVAELVLTNGADPNTSASWTLLHLGCEAKINMEAAEDKAAQVSGRANSGGGSGNDQPKLYFKNFKMALAKKAREAGEAKQDHGNDILITPTFDPEHPRGSPHQISAIHLFSMVLARIKEKAINHLLTREDAKRNNISAITAHDVVFVLTIPAGWDVVAQDVMLKASHKAGLSEHNFGWEQDGFKLALEPEAAAMQLTYRGLVQRKEIVLVADLGGGTADFATLQVGKGRMMESIAAVKCHLHAGNSINDKLFQILIDRQMLGPKTEAVLALSIIKQHIDRDLESGKKVENTTIDLSDALEYIGQLEAKEKEDRGEAVDTNQAHQDAVTRMLAAKASFEEWANENNWDSKQCGVFCRERYFVLSIRLRRDALTILYQDSIQHTKDMLYQCMDESKREGHVVDKIAIVGGLGNSETIQEALKKEFQGKVKKVICPPKPEMVVVLGATYAALGAIQSTIVPRTVGVVVVMPYDAVQWSQYSAEMKEQAKEHMFTRVEPDGTQVKMLANVFQQLWKKGDKLRRGAEGEELPFAVVNRQRQLTFTLVSPDEKHQDGASMFVSQEGYEMIARAEIELQSHINEGDRIRVLFGCDPVYRLQINLDSSSSSSLDGEDGDDEGDENLNSNVEGCTEPGKQVISREALFIDVTSEYSACHPSHIIFIIDRSSSMSDSDVVPSDDFWKNKRALNNRLGAVCQAVTRVIADLNKEPNCKHIVSACGFNDGIPADLFKGELAKGAHDRVRDILAENLRASGGTRFDTGIDWATEMYTQLRQKYRKHHPLFLLLSDGEDGRKNLALPACQKALDKCPGLRMKTVFFGPDPSSSYLEHMRDIASACSGEVYLADDSVSLAQAFVQMIVKD